MSEEPEDAAGGLPGSLGEEWVAAYVLGSVVSSDAQRALRTRFKAAALQRIYRTPEVSPFRPVNEHGDPPVMDAERRARMSCDTPCLPTVEAFQAQQLVPLSEGIARTVAGMRERLEENPGMVGPPLPRRPDSPMCLCGHRKVGHREGSFDFRAGCWNCRDCRGFEETTGESSEDGS